MGKFLDSEVYKRLIGLISILSMVIMTVFGMWASSVSSRIDSVKLDVKEAKQFDIRDNRDDIIKLNSDFNNYKEYNDKVMSEIKQEMKEIDRKIDLILEKL
jgi:peptidoglycan hydrolase CwlO-like protein